MTARDAYASLPPPRPATRAVVVIPAHNESDYIETTLASLVAQRGLDGAPLDSDAFEVLVYANSCSDDTAARVRAFASAHRDYAILVAEEALPPEIAHIGTARGAVMDAAALRLAAIDRPSGVIASTDADTRPAPAWLAWTLHEMRGVDAVMGRILFDPAEWAALPAHTRRTLCEENEYSFTLTQLASQLDPKSYDPWPRHWQRWGPSFAVRSDIYCAVGGVPNVRVLEDFALYDALVAHGARIRHSLRVRVTTSARLDPRAVGGFGTRIGEWNATDDAALQLLVEHPHDTIERLRNGVVLRDARPRPRLTAAEATAVLRRAIKSR
jgi:cellulose synthase/poly-beta-1,6-N-acetylglucosamine synthase-like glycosyltransferase